MTPQEQELIKGLFDRLSQLESQARDPAAERLIAQALVRAPHAIYALVQTVLLQDETLKLANARIEELQAPQRSRNSDRQASSTACGRLSAAACRAARCRAYALQAASKRCRALPASARADRFLAPRPQPPLVSSVAHCCLTASAHSAEPVRVQSTENKTAYRIWRMTTENKTANRIWRTTTENKTQNKI